METARISVKNYRCFPDSQPATIDIGKGFTAFVGQNNSGKSSLLKLFFELRALWGLIVPTGNFLGLLNGNSDHVNVLGVSDQTEIFCDDNDRPIEIEVDLGPSFLSKPDDSTITKVCLQASRSSSPRWSGKFFAGPNYRDISFFRSRRNFNSVDRDTAVVSNGQTNLGCRALFQFMESLGRCIYIGPFRNAINAGSGSYFDLTIGTSFIETWNQWKTGPTKTQNSAITQVTEDIRRIFEFPRLEINASQQLQTLQVIIGNKPYKLSELGAGLAQFIIVLSNVMIRKPTFVLIDEPELNLHPSLQLDFLTSLTSYASEGVVFATHSLGLARGTSERIYSFRKTERAARVGFYEQTAGFVEFLGEMSYSSFKELGCEGVLLVEGVTDVRTTQQFLRKLQKDHRIVILPLGGNSLIRSGTEAELAELNRIGAAVSVLLDREGPDLDSIRKREAFAEGARKIGFNVCLTERRAIENYFTDRAVKAVKGEKYRALRPDEKLSELKCGWAKSENWRIAREMDFDDIKDTDVGRFFVGL